MQCVYCAVRPEISDIDWMNFASLFSSHCFSPFKRFPVMRLLSEGRAGTFFECLLPPMKQCVCQVAHGLSHYLQFYFRLLLLSLSPVVRG